MLDFQMKQTPFRFGLSEGDDPHAVPFGVLTTLENYVWKKSNRVEKRQGVDWQGWGIIGGGILASFGVKRMFTRNSDKELCVFDGATLYSYAQGTATWATVSTLPEAALTYSPLLDPISGVRASDTAVSGNFVVTVFQIGDPTSSLITGGLFVQVTDLVTGALLMPITTVNATAAQVNGCRVVIIGTTAVIVTGGSGADLNIRGYTLDLTTFAVSAATVLRNDRKTGTIQNWDICLIAGTSFFALGYLSGANNGTLYSYDTAFTVQANSTQAISATTSQISIDGALGEGIYFTYADQIALLVRAYIADATTMVTTVVPFTIQVLVGGSLPLAIGVCRYNAASAMVAFTYNATAGVAGAGSVDSVMSWNIGLAGGATALTDRRTQGCRLTSVPFMMNGGCYAFATIGPAIVNGVDSYAPFTGNASVMLKLFPAADDGTSAVDLPHPFVCSADTLLGAGSARETPMPRFTAYTATRSIGSMPFIGTAPTVRRVFRCALRLLNVTAAADSPLDMWRTVSRGPETFIAAGVLSVYDGGTTFDYGFPYAPLGLFLSSSGAGGVMLAGTYIYGTHLEYRGGSGLLYRGPTVQLPGVTTGGATSSTTMSTTNVNVGNKKKANIERFPSQLAIYRTVVNGTIPQRLTEDPSFNTVPILWENIVQSFVDTRGDASIDGLATALATRPAIYTSSGALDDQQPPACITIFSHVDRLFILAGDKRTWWYSKTFNDDIGVAPGFNVAFRIVMRDEQVAGASMDDKAIFFSQGGVSYMLGTGPAKDGTGSDFTTPTRIQTDVGCSNPRSLVSMPEGIMFQSLRGIYILTRNLELIWIGRPVQDTLALYPNITSAVLVPNKNEIRFSANNTAGTNGVVLVYNYIEKQWSTSKYNDAVFTGAYGCPIADACLWNGSYVFVTPAGLVYKESDVHNLDSSVYAPGIIETAWNSAAGPIAYQAVRNFWIQGISNSDHDLTIDIAFDSNNTYLQTKTFPSLSPVTQVGDIEEAKISVGTRRKCNSIRFRVRDTAPSTPGSAVLSPNTTNSGKGPTFQTMGYEVGIKKGDNMGQRKKG